MMTKNPTTTFKTGNGSGTSRSRQKAKTEATRREVIRAARKVFSSYPYAAAGIRTIGQEGGFTHSYIRYHFQSKAGLFEAVSKELIEAYYQSATDLIKGLNGPLLENTRLLTERFVGYAFDHPEVLDMILLNMGALDQIEDAFPGMNAIRGFHEKILDLFASSNYFAAPVEAVNRVFFCFSVILANCVGASRFFGRLLDVNPEDPEYRIWVLDTLVFLFYPSIKQLVFHQEKAPVKTATGAGGIDPGEKIVEKTRSGRQKAESAAILYPTLSNPPLKNFLDFGANTLPRMEGNATKGWASRCRIVDVARRVFSCYPYNTASIRMIGDAGDFDFTLLYHYFPRKEELFEAVAETLLEEYRKSITDIIKDLNGTSIRRDMSVFIDNTLAFCREKPDVMKICIQNIAQADRFEDHPGFDMLAGFLTESLNLFRKTIPFPEADERVRMWMYGFGIVVFNCVGAPAYHARILGMSPGSRQYRQWLKETLMYVFYPCLKDLIFNHRDGPAGQRR